VLASAGARTRAEQASAEPPALVEDGTVPLPVQRPVPVRQLRDRDAGRTARNQVPIMGLVGPNGGGKTLAMVHMALPALKAGRRVLSSVELIDARTGRPYPNFERLTDWKQVLDFHDGLILLDEIMGIANSREASGLPWQVQNVLGQLRHRRALLRWTAPAWSRADKIIREVTQAVTYCTGHLAVRPTGAADEVSLWRERRLFRWKTYDKPADDRWDPATARDMLPLAASWFWRPGSEAEASYRTLDAVSTISDLTAAGMCVNCKGRRVVPRCTCGPDKHE
jgi:hypothetical protein